MINRNGNLSVSANSSAAFRGFLLVCLLLELKAPATRAGQVSFDHSLGQSGQSLTGPNYSITANNGLTRGNNLFFSSNQFNLDSGETATFSGPNNIQNILSRVTGSGPSSINGTIISSIAGANLYLINPNGIIFGPNAQINVSGSFAASTANYLKLSDGAKFVAALGADDSGLSTAPVSAFGFMGTQTASIQVQQGSLAVPNASTLSLIGGDVLVDGGTLQAPGGQVNVVSVQSAGEVPVDPSSISTATFNAAFPQQGNMTFQNVSLVDASGNGGGHIVIRGGQLTVDNSVVQANTTGSGDGQGIDISVSGALDLSNGGQIDSLSPAGLGASGNITLTAQSITLNGGGAVDANYNPTTQISAETGDSVNGTGGGPANGGNIVINAGSLDLVNSAQISSASYGAGNAGNIDITASSVTVDAQLYSITQIIANSQLNSGGGNAGDITISTGSLNVQNAAVIAAATFGNGNAGIIDIAAGTVNFSNYGGIAVSTFGSGQGGSVQITADTVQLDSGSFINAVTTGTGFAQGSGLGQGGNIAITANSVELLNGSTIFSQTYGDGNSGDINLTAKTVSVASGSGILASDGSPYFGFGIGNGGNVVINTGSLDLSGGGQIMTSTLGTGSAGTVGINANIATLEGGSMIESASTGSQLGTGLGGLAGGVTLDLKSYLSLSGSSIISVSSVENDAGDVTVNAGGNINLTGSQINAQAGLNGGNISLTSPSLIYLLGSPLSANAQNGNGGVVALDPSLVVLNQSPLTAKVSVQGNGGTVRISSDYFFSSQSPFDVSTPSGIPGTVVVTAPNIDLSGVLVALSGNFLDEESQLRPACGIRLSGDVSSFITLGLGGLPLAPGGFVPSTVPKGGNDR